MLFAIILAIAATAILVWLVGNEIIDKLNHLHMHVVANQADLLVTRIKVEELQHDLTFVPDSPAAFKQHTDETMRIVRGEN